MKKTITTICLILSAVIILDAFHAWHAIGMFYLAGEIPGTDRSISPDMMMQIFALIGGFVVARISNRAVLNTLDRLFAKRPSIKPTRLAH